MIFEFENYKKNDILRDHLRLGKPSRGNDTITVNSRYFEKNGEPFIGVMGELHFSRIRREEWRDRLEKMKAGGINIVATYIFWIYHEEIEGIYDFTGNLDLRAFILEAQDVGLDVIIRIGPWAHGECRHGGFPDWLLAKGFRLRDNNPEYLAFATAWYRRIYDEVKGLFYRDGGNIIGVQFENELVNAPEHLLKLKEIALSIGYDAPIYTATGWNSKFGARIPVDEFIPVFAAYADAPWAKGIERRPPSPHFCFDCRRNDSLVGNDVISEEMTDSDGWRLPYERYPFALCELGSGVQSTYQRRTVISDLDAYAVALVKLGCGNNLIGYYMYAGGTNKIGKLSTLQETRSTGSPNDYTVRNYDFHTAITEYGEVTPRYGMLNLLHLFVSDFGALLAPMEHVPAKNPSLDPADSDSLRYALRTDGKSGFVFVNNHQRYLQLSEHKNVSFKALNVTIPEITVKNDDSFFMPVNIPLGGLSLEYATAQPVCRTENTFFFVKIGENAAKFKFKDMDEFTAEPFDCISVNGIGICVLPFEKAVYLRRFFGKIHIGNGCNLYEHGNLIRSVENVDSFEFLEFNNNGTFTAKTQKQPEPYRIPTVPENNKKPYFSEFENKMSGSTEMKISVSEFEKMLDYPKNVRKEIVEELHVAEDAMLSVKFFGLSKNQNDANKRIRFSEDGFASIEDRFDVALVISEGKLVADKFYDRLPFRIPARCLTGPDSFVVMSAPRDDVFIDEL